MRRSLPDSVRPIRLATFLCNADMWRAVDLTSCPNTKVCCNMVWVVWTALQSTPDTVPSMGAVYCSPYVLVLAKCLSQKVRFLGGCRGRVSGTCGGRRGGCGGRGCTDGGCRGRGCTGGTCGGSSCNWCCTGGGRGGCGCCCWCCTGGGGRGCGCCRRGLVGGTQILDATPPDTSPGLHGTGELSSSRHVFLKKLCKNFGKNFKSHSRRSDLDDASNENAASAFLFIHWSVKPVWNRFWGVQCLTCRWWVGTFCRVLKRGGVGGIPLMIRNKK